MEKSKRIDRVVNSLREDDLLRRLPEITKIENTEVRDCTIRTFIDGCPDYFWENPTSSSGKYHSPDERGKHGNWIHTKRVFSQYANMSESYLEAGSIDEYQRDCGKAAALIHDMMKYGWPSDNSYHTVRDHDIIAADVTRDIGDCPNEVYLLVHAHMGPWGQGMVPDTQRQWLFHLADKSASGVDEDDLAVFKPAEEIVSEVPEILVIPDEELADAV